MTTLLYNFLMLAVDVAAVLFLRRHRNLPGWCNAMACAGGAALAMAVCLGGLFENRFGIIRLSFYGIFLHGTVLFAATAILWRRSRPGRISAIVAVLALLAVAVDAILIEPTWLEVSHWKFASPKIRRPVRIVVLADLQTDCIGPYERRVFEQVLAEKPDIILLAGDYLQFPWKTQPLWEAKQKILRSDLSDLLRELHFSAPRGVFGVQGNVDPDDWGKPFQGVAETVGPNTWSFDLGDVRLTCLGLYDSVRTTLAITNDSPDRFHLVLGHVPNFAMGTIEADLCVTGHTHGGQVRLPFLGTLITKCNIPHAWAAGLTELPNGGKLLVSRGIGMERNHAPPIRFLCRPELLVIDLMPDEKAERMTQK